MSISISVARARTRAGDNVNVVLGLFFCSGLASLIYQVLWMRQLSLFFGSDVYSAAITLSVFMGGLALGSAVAARVADRLTDPLRIYGALEVGIGVYALVFARLLDALDRVNRDVYQSVFDGTPWLYHLFRVSVAAASL